MASRRSRKLIDAAPLPERIIVYAILNDIADDEELVAHLRIEGRQLEAGNRNQSTGKMSSGSSGSCRCTRFGTPLST
jgi:hypothetical protein